MKNIINAVLLEKNGIKKEEVARDIIALCYKKTPRVKLIKKNGLYYIIQEIK